MHHRTQFQEAGLASEKHNLAYLGSSSCHKGASTPIHITIIQSVAQIGLRDSSGVHHCTFRRGYLSFHQSEGSDLTRKSILVIEGINTEEIEN